MRNIELFNSMIGKPEWFKRRKYGGWGLYPATWQGWTYLAVLTVVILGTQVLPPNEKIRIFSLGFVALITIADTIDIMFRMKKDERETIHEAIAERNALWAILVVLTAGVAYQAAVSAITGNLSSIDPVVIIAIAVALIAKAATNIYLDRKN